jgi:hypothetical protein
MSSQGSKGLKPGTLASESKAADEPRLPDSMAESWKIFQSAMRGKDWLHFSKGNSNYAIQWNKMIFQQNITVFQSNTPEPE